MITLCLDTSHTYLVVALIQDDTLLDSYSEPCPKQQSEKVFPVMIELLEKNHLGRDDIDQVVITKGPGSYTGVRIAMSIAKVLRSIKHIPLYTIGTLRLYAGDKKCRVVLDARGKRAYTAVYENGKEIEAPNVKAIDEISESGMIVGDGALFGKDNDYEDLAENFLLTKPEWHLEENVHLVVPDYLKDKDAYLTGK